MKACAFSRSGERLPGLCAPASPGDDLVDVSLVLDQAAGFCRMNFPVAAWLWKTMLKGRFCARRQRFALQGFLQYPDQWSAGHGQPGIIKFAASEKRQSSPLVILEFLDSGRALTRISWITLWIRFYRTRTGVPKQPADCKIHRAWPRWRNRTGGTVRMAARLFGSSCLAPEKK